MKIGHRIIKTGIAVTITMFICQKLNLEPSVFGAVSAVINLQPSLHLTYKKAGEQVIVHILGVMAGILFGYMLGGTPLTMGAITIFIIILYNKLNLHNGIMMGIVAAIFILSASPDQFFHHAFTRSAVIFTGLIVAMLVNIILWPPRHGSRFNDLLRESNEMAVKYFCRAVHDFVRMDNQHLPQPLDMRQQVINLYEECCVLADYYRRERKQVDAGFDSVDPNEWFNSAEKLSKYNRLLVEKADQIYDILPARLERRLKSGNQSISQEFKAILEILDSGCDTIIRINHKLRSLICDKKPVETEEISERFWGELTLVIDKWQSRLTGSYYLHALIEASMVAGEIRWASREAKKILNSAINR
ncbi:FUSC family protein [Desulfoscipio gibsoniae]|uniref:Putative membrane protein n=1 Tax=Desulfoscipio gibsoniae DSM 7213 TaxID=767817 RepID=R4KMQ5_9FIRM|nr:aromatic acid exporter family protein [Desulfoscipio gibsoniae]AGL01830.1 putative membrane protein [Desulfoscipio gibsoniae DSM 7213]